MVERLEILSLAPQGLGTQYSKCPACSRANKFSISRLEDGSILYRCFRPSCRLHRGGAVTPNGVRQLAARSTNVTYVTRPYTGVLEPLPPELREVLWTEAGFLDTHIERARLLWAPELDRVAFPILDPTGRRDGWLLRSYNGTTPKALTRMETARPGHSYYNQPHPINGATLVVEDAASALRAGMYVNTVALLGAGLGNDAAIEIAAHRPDVIFALDKDATETALGLLRRHRLLFNSSRVVALPKDLKNMQEQELSQFLLEVL